MLDGRILRQDGIFEGGDYRHHAMLAIDDAQLDGQLSLKKHTERNDGFMVFHSVGDVELKAMVIAEAINVHDVAEFTTSEVAEKMDDTLAKCIKLR